MHYSFMVKSIGKIKNIEESSNIYEEIKVSDLWVSLRNLSHSNGNWGWIFLSDTRFSSISFSNHFRNNSPRF